MIGHCHLCKKKSEENVYCIVEWFYCENCYRAIVDGDLGRLMKHADAVDDSERGLYGKYKIERTDGKAMSPGFRFVLSPANDPAARAALETYAATTKNKFLGYDIQRELAKIKFR